MVSPPRSTVRVLVVDDDPLMVEHVRLMLEADPDIDFRGECLAGQAVLTATAFLPTVILQDIGMPEIGGLDLIAQYRNTEALAHVPIVMFSGSDCADLKSACFSAGANDYLVKCPERAELIARIRYHSKSYLNSVELHAAFLQLQHSQRQLANANDQLQTQNGLDSLTGIANRRKFDEVMAKEWLRATRMSTTLSMLMCDVDHFKPFNDTFGHGAGDICLKRVAKALSDQLKRPADLATRYGGEEFAILLPDMDVHGAMAVAEGCRQRVRDLCIPAHNGNGACVTISIGVGAMVPTPGHTVFTLINRADAALYQAKRDGRDRLCFLHEA
jgi:two-component system chemotaxis family response regulator WspR